MMEYETVKMPKGLWSAIVNVLGNVVIPLPGRDVAPFIQAVAGAEIVAPGAAAAAQVQPDDDMA